MLTEEIVTPAIPATGKMIVYPRADGRLYIMDDTGAEMALFIADPAPTTVTAPYLALATDRTILATASAALTISLPTAAGRAGKRYTIKKMDSSANVVTIDPNGAETIDGAATHGLTTQYARVTIESNGANWIIVG